MKSIVKLLLCCWKEDQEKEKEAEENAGDVGENEGDKSSDQLKHMSFEEPDKEKTPDCDVTEIKDKKALRVNRPSIILSMEGSVHQVVLYEEKEQKKKKRTKHKKREKVRKPKKQ